MYGARNQVKKIIQEKRYAAENNLKVDPADPCNSATVSTITQYDSAGRVTKTYRSVDYSDEEIDDYTVLLSETAYNPAGKVDWTVNQNGVLTKYEYDENGNLTETIVYEDKSAYQTWYWNYPASLNRILTVSQTLYDAEGKVRVSVSAHDPAESADGAENIYDELGRVTETKRWADVEIQMADITDAQGYLIGRKSTGWSHAYSEPKSYTRTEYDAAGRVKSTFVLDEAGYEQPTSYEYDLAGKQIAVIDALGHDITYNDDDPCYSGPRPGGVAGFTLNGSHRTETEYEGGRRTLVRDALTNETEFIYDAVGRLLQTTYASADLDHDGNADDTSYTYTRYDSHGRKALQTAQTRQTDPNHIDDPETEINDWMLRKREFFYNTAGSLNQVKLAGVDDPEDSPDAGETVQPVYEYFYDKYGNQVGILDSKSRLCVFKYNEIHKQTARYMPFAVTPGSIESSDDVYAALYAQSPQPAVETHQYDNFGRLEAVTNCQGQCKEFVYDSLGRLSFKYLYDSGSAEPDKIIEYIYDSLGRKIQVIVDDDIELDIYYDTEGRVERIVTPQGSIGYDYSGVTGRRTSVYTPAVDPDTKVDYAYDCLGRLDVVTTDKRNGVDVDEVTTYGYTDVGNTDWVCLPNGGCADYEYDNLNRLTLLENKDPCDVVLSSFEYELSADGMRVSVTESDSLGDIAEIFWDYDSLNRLLKEDYDDKIGTSDYEHDYIYDLVGNRLSVTKDSVSTYYEYNERDELLTESPNSDYSDPNIEYGYDDNGTLVLKTDHVNDVVYEYTYNLDNRLSAFILKEQPVGTPDGTVLASFDYDPDGNRIEKTASGVTTDYLIDPYNPTGYAQIFKKFQGANETAYMIGNDILAQASGSSTPDYLLYDGHGSVRQVADDDGVITESYDFDAYGNAIGFDPSSASTDLLYTGELLDVYTGNYYLRARDYGPQIGRFNRRDEFSGNKTEPLTLHKYIYCNDDPVNNIDPTGYMTGTLTETKVSISVGEVIRDAVITAYLIHQIYSLDQSVSQRAAQREIELFVQMQASTGTLTQQQFEELEERVRQKLRRRNRKKLYLHYSFQEQWGNLMIGLAPAGVYNSEGSFATRDVYPTGWIAKMFLAQDGPPRNAIYIVMPKHGFGPTLHRKVTEKYGMPGGGYEYIFGKGSGGPGTVFPPIPIPEGENPL